MGELQVVLRELQCLNLALQLAIAFHFGVPTIATNVIWCLASSWGSLPFSAFQAVNKLENTPEFHGIPCHIYTPRRL